MKYLGQSKIDIGKYEGIAINRPFHMAMSRSAHNELWWQRC